MKYNKNNNIKNLLLDKISHNKEIRIFIIIIPFVLVIISILMFLISKTSTSANSSLKSIKANNDLANKIILGTVDYIIQNPSETEKSNAIVNNIRSILDKLEGTIDQNTKLTKETTKEDGRLITKLTDWITNITNILVSGVTGLYIGGARKENDIIKNPKKYKKILKNI